MKMKQNKNYSACDRIKKYYLMAEKCRKIILEKNKKPGGELLVSGDAGKFHKLYAVKKINGDGKM